MAIVALSVEELTDLPDYILIKILQYGLSVEELSNLKLVSKRFNDLISDESFIKAHRDLVRHSKPLLLIQFNAQYSSCYLPKENIKEDNMTAKMENIKEDKMKPRETEKQYEAMFVTTLPSDYPSGLIQLLNPNNFPNISPPSSDSY
ncbi:hypothetical protein TSUD_255190 [Trifolium subterraneum]|uniref:F-box domain-containing protein n=1 Tax=Trifolium subterraneum TaxID=3900 RepID=A0A2Z6NK00_TRISU|nr:hypothetical protein TSUD_255190 [Trifolium subterraneum]